MRALRLYDKEDVRLEEVATPSCGPSQVRIKPAFVGICGTDVHEYTSGPTLIPKSAHPLTGCQAPITIGHEISGVVDEVGAEVTDIKKDQRIVVQPIVSDGDCRSCLLGKPNICRQQGFYGLSIDGGLADYIVVDRSNIKLLPSSIPLDVGALVEPLSVGWHAVRRSQVSISGSSSLVLGAGPIGLAVIQALVARKAKHIIVCEPAEKKRTIALGLGATHAYDPRQNDIPMECQRLAQGEGVHVAFDCVGKQITLDQAVKSTGPGGTVVNIAIWGRAAQIMPDMFSLGERIYMGSSVYTESDFEQVIDAILKGDMKPAGMITSTVPLEKVVSDGFEAGLMGNSEQQIKILVYLNVKST